MSNSTLVRVGRRVVHQRKMIDETQHELARRIGITSEQLKTYERGDCIIPASHLWAIAIAQDVPIKFYFEDDAETGES